MWIMLMLAPIIERIAFSFANDADVMIAKIDGSANDIALDGFDFEARDISVPRIYFKLVSGKILDYHCSWTQEDIIAFIQRPRDTVPQMHTAHSEKGNSMYGYRALEDMVGERHTQYHCSLFPVMKLFTDIENFLTPKHKELMMATPFSHLLIALSQDRVRGIRKKDKCLDCVLSTYDKVVKAFRIGDQFYNPTRLDVKLIFGFEDGTERIGDMKLRSGFPYDFGQRVFGNSGQIKMPLLKEKVVEYAQKEDPRSREDTVKLLCLVLMQCFLLPNSSGCMPRGFLQYVDSFETMNQFDWSGKVHEYLMEGLRGKWSTGSKVIGCTVFLLYWLCERSTMLNEALRRMNGAHLVGLKAVPRVCKWTLTDVEKLVNAEVLASQEEIEFVGGELDPTGEEVVVIHGLAEELDAMELASMENGARDTVQTNRDTYMARDDAAEDKHVDGSEVPPGNGEPNDWVAELCDGIDFCTPTFSLGLTQEFSTKVIEHGETSNVRTSNVPDTTVYDTPLQLCYDVRTAGAEPSSKNTSTLHCQSFNLDRGNDGQPMWDVTPGSEIETSPTLMNDLKEVPTNAMNSPSHAVESKSETNIGTAVRHHVVDDEPMMKAQLTKSPLEYGAEGIVSQLVKEVEEQKARIYRLEVERGKQSNVIEALIRIVRKENVNMQGEAIHTADKQVSDATGASKSSTSLYKRKRSGSVLSEKKMDAGQSSELGNR